MNLESCDYSIDFPRFVIYDLLMGHSGKFEEKIKAQEFRKKGYSYGEILKQIKVSKDTLSRWCKEIELTEQQKLRLINNKILGQKKGSVVAADNKRRARVQRTEAIHEEASTELGLLSKRDRFVAGICLYAGEGDKTDGHGGFANSDPKIIRFMMSWFLEFCNLPMSKFRGSIWLHEELDEKKAKQFWSRTTRIPKNQFYKTYLAKNKTESRKIRKRIHEYGVFAIKFNDSAKQRRIMGWIYALLDDRILDDL